MSGVGTELSKLIPDWAVSDKKGCKCKSMAAKWDKYGVAWCERNKTVIVNHLMSQVDRLNSVLKMLPKAAHEKGTEILVNKAIKNARKEP